MPGKCPYVKRDGSVCGLGMRPGFDHCAAHRPRGAARLFHPCSTCGSQTRRIVDGAPLCLRQSCGLNEYYRSLRARHKAEAAAAFSEREQQERAAEEMDSLIADLLENFQPVSPPQPPPPPAWSALSEDARRELLAWFDQTRARQPTPAGPQNPALALPASISAH